MKKAATEAEDRTRLRKDEPGDEATVRSGRAALNLGRFNLEREVMLRSANFHFHYGLFGPFSRLMHCPAVHSFHLSSPYSCMDSLSLWTIRTILPTHALPRSAFLPLIIALTHSCTDSLAQHSTADTGYRSSIQPHIALRLCDS